MPDRIRLAVRENPSRRWYKIVDFASTHEILVANAFGFLCVSVVIAVCVFANHRGTETQRGGFGEEVWGGGFGRW
jgi:hypothetical protein